MKHMKKSMFITTVMMVVLLIVAVSTATFAWYTSSNTVNTVATQVNSAQSTGANISIGWTESTPVGTSSLEFYTNSTPFSPMVPTITEAEGTFSFTNATTFYTANISYGTLSNHGTATPYIGKQAEGGSSTFYVINYSATKATNITFDSNETGENAARLRVAVFNADTGALVYTNADLYWGMLMEPDAAVFAMTTEQPTGWADNYANYSTSGTEYVPVTAVAPAFQPNTYYSGGTVLTSEPGDWVGQYATYSTSPSLMVPVVGVAPTWVADKYYAYTAPVPERLVAPGAQKFNAYSTPTQVAAADGVVGTAQGFIVKAWFDGPSQVDAYGGTNATFTLTASATNVA